MSYKVGQVIYAVLRKEATVFPIQIVEEVVRRTLDGEATTYMVRAGADPKKVMAIADIDGEIFDNAATAKAMLVERATRTIGQRVDQAVAKAKEWYPSGHEARSGIDLGNLVKDASTVRNTEQSSSMVRPEVAMLAAELTAESQASTETFVELPGGVKAKVKSVKLPSELG